MTLLEQSAPRVAHRHPLRLAVLGSSGSIGTQALDVCRKHPRELSVTALAVKSSCGALVAAAREFNVDHVAVADKTRRHDSVLDELPQGCELSFGSDAVTHLASLPDVDCVLVAIVGLAGVWASYEALRYGKVWAPANKEALVAAGDLLMPLAKPGHVVPVDSEHSAIFQCLVGEHARDIHRIWLTCSGGPFFGRTRHELTQVSVAEALEHPTWAMGPKITIDSATLMNKGLEAIEAHHLFGVDIDDISVLVQRQSRIHSAVEFTDGSVKAQLGPSDMRIPIQYALSYPERWESPCERVDYCSLEPLTFDKPDMDAFRCLPLALEAGRRGGTLPCIMNAANEVANAAFRAGECGFTDIDSVVERVMQDSNFEPLTSLEQVAHVDADARARARRAVERVVR